MTVNNYRILFDSTTDKEINIPLQINWDFVGQDQSIEIYQEDVTRQVIGIGYDFEVARFPHDEDEITKETSINYEFHFYSGGNTSQQTSWKISYSPEGMTNSDIYYLTNDFTKSFFKLDFYDTVDEKTQTNYFTIILPTTQGERVDSTLGNLSVKLKIPKFSLDYVGDKEGFFIYWLKKLEFLNLNTFYMSAKFYNAKIGQFVKLMNTCQAQLPSNTLQQNVDPILYFYYRVVLDYTNTTYRVYNIQSNQRVGTTVPIKWFEFVGP